ncbi:MAG: hypothetical protein NTY09_06480 [bacterium]|nr:hypothetical protein [bacterium]
MVRFFRILLITLIVLAALAYGAAWILADHARELMYKPLTTEFIGAFGPSQDDIYRYDVSVKLWPPTVIVYNLIIQADVLRIDLDTWRGAHLGIDRIELELIPLLKEQKLAIKKIEGRKFVGLLTNDQLEIYLQRNSPGMRDLDISQYQEKCRIRGEFGLVSVVPITLLGEWTVDDRGVATFQNREYYNPDSVVPEGYIQIVEEQNKFDVRVEILGEGLITEQCVYNSAGLWISAVEQ